MSAIIPINNKYRIELDTNSCHVSYWMPRNSHPNNGTWECKSWHKTLQKAGESLVQRLVSEEDLEGLDEIINAIASSSRLIATAISESGILSSWLSAKKIDTESM